MTDHNDILRSARDIATNMDDLISDIENLEEHEHDADACRDCQTIREEADENHSHDTWACSGCEELADEQFGERVGELDADGLMDHNYSLWQDIGEEAVAEYQNRTGEVIAALDELAQRVLGLYSTVDSTDVDDVTEAINYITEKVYGVREERKPIPQEDIVEIALNIGDDAPKDSLTLNNAKCSCGVDHSLANYETDNGSTY